METEDIQHIEEAIRKALGIPEKFYKRLPYPVTPIKDKEGRLLGWLL